jgi:hypothetical protein
MHIDGAFSLHKMVPGPWQIGNHSGKELFFTATEVYEICPSRVKEHAFA